MAFTLVMPAFRAVMRLAVWMAAAAWIWARLDWVVGLGGSVVVAARAGVAAARDSAHTAPTVVIVVMMRFMLSS